MDYIDVSAWEGARAPQGRRPERQEAGKRMAGKRAAARRARRRRRFWARVRFSCLVLLAGLLLGMVLWRLLLFSAGHPEQEDVQALRRQTEMSMVLQEKAGRPEIVEDFLTPNPYSRPGERLPEVKNIFVHYTANPGTTAEQNRSYFENLGITGETSASAHFVIGFDGTIIQCIPLNEIGYAVKSRNYDSISIECCYQSEDGSFTRATYDSLIELTAWLLKKYGLSPGDVLRHYDEGGKKCPLYFVEHEGAWEAFRQDLADYMDSKG